MQFYPQGAFRLQGRLCLTWSQLQIFRARRHEDRASNLPNTAKLLPFAKPVRKAPYKSWAIFFSCSLSLFSHSTPRSLLNRASELKSGFIYIFTRRNNHADLESSSGSQRGCGRPWPLHSHSWLLGADCQQHTSPPPQVFVTVTSPSPPHTHTHRRAHIPSALSGQHLPRWRTQLSY